MCSGKRKHPASDEDEEASISTSSGSGEPSVTFFAGGLQPPMMKPSELLALPAAASEPIPVYTGPTRTGAALIAAVAGDVERQTPPAHAHAKKRVAEKKDAAATPNTDAAKPDAKPAKPAGVKHASAKPDAAPKAADAPAATTDPATAKPAKPKTTAKTASKPAVKPKPAPKSAAGDAKPSDAKPVEAAPHS
jgi:D-alanyl-D-alanine carboxypeptidase